MSFLIFSPQSMIMPRIAISFFIVALLFSPFLTFANRINVEDHPSAQIGMSDLALVKSTAKSEVKSLRREERTLRCIEKFNHRIHKRLNAKKNQSGIFSDPVGRWFWIWIISWSFGLAVTILAGSALTGGFIPVIWLLSFAVGAIALVIWLKKKFG